MSALFPIADTKRFVLSGARVLAAHLPDLDAPADREGFVLVDIAVDRGRIADIAPAGARDFGDAPKAALGGRIVLPTFIDSHTHLDKGHIWRRAPNLDGTFQSAVDAVAKDRAAHWTAQDVAARMEFALRSAYAYGTAAIRTHIDSLGPQTRISWPVVAEARERWRGRIELQATPLFSIDFVFDERHMADIEAMLDAYGSNILGAVTYMVPRLAEGIERLFALAERKGWDLDFHVDESADPAARSLKVIAETALARRFPGRILVGHCCSLALHEPDEAQRTIEAVAKAGISVVSLPACNMFLQDRRAARTPRWRGVTAFHEFREAGVNVMIASDNTRDSFHPYGDLDMIETWREGTRILHLDYPFAGWAPVTREAPAKAMGLALEGMRAGASADLVVTSARDFTELFARPQADRIVLRNGATLAPPPDYAELDALEGLS